MLWLVGFIDTFIVFLVMVGSCDHLDGSIILDEGRVILSA